ncbi:MAG TPA: arylesterase [Acidobacteriaceae bacterium]|nr:arylesterase [Acidobacteriaceae bacterium]
MALCLFFGCGKSNPPTPDAQQDTPSAVVPTPAPPASLIDDHRPVIVAFGDSLTAGFGTDPGQSYPDNLQRDLDARGYSYRVVNAGISGNTTKDGVDRLPSVLALHPTIVILAFGGNDGLRGIPITDSRRNLTTIVQTLLKAHIRVILGGITLPPNYGQDYIAQFNQTYAMLAHAYHLPLLPFLLQGVYGVPGSMQADGMHATAQGNQQVARNLLPLLLPLLRK